MILLSSFLSPLSQELYSCSPAAAFPSAAKSFEGCQFRKEWEKKIRIFPLSPCAAVFIQLRACIPLLPAFSFFLAIYLFVSNAKTRGSLGNAPCCL